jgi:hypothetical protein
MKKNGTIKSHHQWYLTKIRKRSSKPSKRPMRFKIPRYTINDSGYILINRRAIRAMRLSSREIEGARVVAGEVDVEGVAEAAMRATDMCVVEL